MPRDQHGTLDLSHPALNPISNPEGFAKAHRGTPANVASVDDVKSAMSPEAPPDRRAMIQMERQRVQQVRTTLRDIMRGGRKKRM